MKEEDDGVIRKFETGATKSSALEKLLIKESLCNILQAYAGKMSMQKMRKN